MRNSISYLDHAIDILAQVATYVRMDRPFALITSVDIKGGSARDVGSLAVVSDDGVMTGYMSNGCIDQDILLHGVEAARTGASRLLRYGEGSPFHDLTLPCGGSLTVWIDATPDVDALLIAYKNLRSRTPATLTFQPRADEAAQADIVTITYQPKVSFVLAGRGAIFRAAAKNGQAAGFEVQAFSPDIADLEAVTPFCIAAPTHMRSQSEMPPLSLDPICAALTLFHDHDWEPAFLMAALGTPARFIGALGSRRTHAGRLEHLRALGQSQKSVSRVRGPIGLVPSLRDANLIAISAIAEIAGEFAYDQQTLMTTGLCDVAI